MDIQREPSLDLLFICTTRKKHNYTLSVDERRFAVLRQKKSKNVSMFTIGLLLVYVFLRQQYSIRVVIGDIYIYLFIYEKSRNFTFSPKRGVVVQIVSIDYYIFFALR